MRFEKAEMMATKSSGENFISDCFFSSVFCSVLILPSLLVFVVLASCFIYFLII